MDKNEIERKQYMYRLSTARSKYKHTLRVQEASLKATIMFSAITLIMLFVTTAVYGGFSASVLAVVSSMSTYLAQNYYTAGNEGSGNFLRNTAITFGVVAIIACLI